MASTKNIIPNINTLLKDLNNTLRQNGKLYKYDYDYRTETKLRKRKCCILLINKTETTTHTCETLNEIYHTLKGIHIQTKINI